MVQTLSQRTPVSTFKFVLGQAGCHCSSQAIVDSTSMLFLRWLPSPANDAWLYKEKRVYTLFMYGLQIVYTRLLGGACNAFSPAAWRCIVFPKAVKPLWSPWLMPPRKHCQGFCETITVLNGLYMATKVYQVQTQIDKRPFV
jgi:hypothetical protein